MTLDELLALKASRPKPLKVVHCGSTERAKEAFQHWRLQDTLNNRIVLTIGVDAKDSDLGISAEEKVALDILHLHKIDEADLVRILNVGGYLGESTRREIDYAQRLGNPLVFLEPRTET
ncbi:MAG: hypothetical protein JO202_01695 [Ktedonobacteraceae bacterium]|nr:hypothetical protein [Ktedonobacteraceae bacterium]